MKKGIQSREACIYLTQLLMLLFSLPTVAQQVTVEWAEGYDSQGTTSESSGYVGKMIIAVDEDGNSYVAGRSMNYNTYRANIVTTKHSPAGEELWVRVYEGVLNSEPTAIAVDNAGGVYVTGVSVTGYERYDALHYGTDYLTVRYSALDGTLTWDETYNGAGNGSDVARAVAVDTLGGVYVTGESYSGSSGIDYTTIRYAASDGTLTWGMTYNGIRNSYDYGRAIAVDNLGGVYVTGASWSGARRIKYTTIRYAASDGTLTWGKTYKWASNSYDYGRVIVVDNLGGVYITGESWSGACKNNYMTIRYAASDGTLTWDEAEYPE
ncbi:SBBP repeat-containing protein [Pontibacter toksunensis]|uniref:SBBP repeat-containing protein n=1 Tax=Pontibacter toksunensis TaxID=1332631 RepID=A0ABW6BUX9_9BACT